MLNDLPTKTDLLGRRPFAESIARVIVTQTDPAPQVIAIDGAWGDGKTTVFGFLSNALTQQGFKVVSFNPWRYKNEDAMLRGFAINLAETLGVHVLNKSEQWIEVAVDRGALVEETAGAVGFGSLGRLFHLGAKSLRQSVEQLLSKTRGLLNEHGQRVTVLVDDPDRLEAEQLLGLFRLIKLTADFDWLTFVLAMDCSAIIRTVGDRFGGPEEGMRFLEKIVQVPVRLPTVPHTMLREFTLQQVDRVLADLKVELSQDEAVRFRGVFDPALMPLIRTPRAVKQYANVIRFSLGLLPNEVNPVDVMLLEGIRLFARELFDNISDRIIPKVDAHWLDEIMEEQEDRAEKLMKSLLAGLDESEAKGWREALTMLFPPKLSRATYGENQFLAWTDSRRVACDEYFVRYLAAVIPESDIPDAELTRWMDEANGGDNEALASKLQERINPRNEEVLVQKLRRIQRQLNDSQRTTFAVAMARLAHQLTLRDIANQSEVAFGQSAIFAAQCVGGIKRPDALENAASEVIKSTSSGIWAVEFFWSLRHKRERHADENNEEQFLPEETSARLGALLSQKLMNDVESADPRPPMEMLRRAFLITEKYGDLDQVRRWTKSELDKDPTFVRPLIGLMMQGLYSGSERHQEWPGDKEALRKVRAYTDAEWLAGTFTPEQPEKQIGWTSGISDEEAVFRLICLLKQPVGEGAQSSADNSD